MVFPPIRAHGPCKEDEHPANTPAGVASLFLYLTAFDAGIGWWASSKVSHFDLLGYWLWSPKGVDNDHPPRGLVKTYFFSKKMYF